MPSDDDGPKSTGETGGAVAGTRDRGASIRELDKTVSKNEKLDEPQAEPPAADEFGLPARPPRRREYSVSLNDLETPDQIARKVIEETGGVQASPAKEASEGATTSNTKAQSVDDADGSEKFATPRTSLEKDGKATSVTSPASTRSVHSPSSPTATHKRGKASINTISEWSHQQMAPQPEIVEEKEDEGEWQDMPALATHRIYDDWGKVIAKEYGEVDDETVAYSKMGGAGKGYTRVQVDEDAQSATSMDENTAYLFKEPASNALDDDGDESRDITSQMQATKEILTEGQRIAYVGIVRLSLVQMSQEMDKWDKTKNAKKAVEYAIEANKMWSQKVMVRLYTHMEIDAREQIMVEQLAEHGVLPSDLTPTLMQNARVKNPNAAPEATSAPSSARVSTSSPRPATEDADKTENADKMASSTHLSAPGTPAIEAPPPAYQEQNADQLTVQQPEDLENEKNIDIDLRWTVLCDLFLLLIGESSYDARSRTLLERVGEALSVDWQEITRFEKRVTDALEVQEQAEKENWNEDEHLEARRKAALRKRYVVMGLCTVGGGLVIGLSSGLLAPVIGAGLAAGFTGIGVAGTGAFLGGTGAAALIGTTGTLIGGGVGLKTSNRRTGAVKTFEYKPLYNNKRANLIVTVAGWTAGKADDVRLPFSTVDPIMGDIYSVNWEPDMLRSTGATIQILATEALTSTIQQILGATLLATLMAGLSPPIVLLKISYLIDNPWTVSLSRADATGLILADSLIDRNLGLRPITLVGFSLGARVIFSCLKELAKRGAIGLIQNVYLFGSPVVAKKDDYTRARTVVSGRFINGYATNDWILGYLFRATSGGIRRVAGLASVDVPGIDNRDITEWVPGHMAYRGMMPILLDQVGWKVDSLEFTEIEDPDPDNHEQRQRELLNEIKEAREQLEEQPEKKGFKAFFSRRKAPQKKAWETYDERSQRVLEGDEKESERYAEENPNVLFDVDAIRKEALALAIQNPSDIDDIKKHLSVREIETTMPALKISTATTAAGSHKDSSPAQSAGTPSSATSRPDAFRQSRSYEPTTDSITTPNTTHQNASSSSLQIPKTRSPDKHHVDDAAFRPPARAVTYQYHGGSTDRDAGELDGGIARPPPSRDASRSPGRGDEPRERQQSPSQQPQQQPLQQQTKSGSAGANGVRSASTPALSRPEDDEDDPEFGKESEEVEMSFE